MLSKSRIEYLSHGVNWRKGCRHDCLYCYMSCRAGMAKRFDHLAPESGRWAEPEATVEDPLAEIVGELQGKTTMPQGPIMLSTSHDPAMDEECARQSADVVGALGGFGILDRTMYLTKSPLRALRALNGIGAGEGLRFGCSLTSMGQWLTDHYEPGAEMPEMRICALVKAHGLGYATWVSLEPPLPDVYLHKLVEEILNLPGRPWVVLGRLNMRGSPEGDTRLQELAHWAQSDHWAWDRDEAVHRLEQAGYVESLTPVSGGYWVKRELAAA
jgi:DNA repair photolyase